MNGASEDTGRFERPHDLSGRETDGRDASDIFALAARIQGLNRRAAVEYAPLVEHLIRSDCRDVPEIERTLDGLLDFCGHGPVLLLYRRLCRHLWDIDPAATAFYIRSYREMWEEESLPKKTQPPE